jgi:hypothetical protein
MALMEAVCGEWVNVRVPWCTEVADIQQYPRYTVRTTVYKVHTVDPRYKGRVETSTLDPLITGEPLIEVTLLA